MLLRVGDKLNATPQIDGSLNVVVDLKHPDGDRRIVGNTQDPDAFYTRARARADNPPEIDLVAEKEYLEETRARIDAEIIKVDERIAIKDAPAKEVTR
jgi:hypothetical protein